MADIVERCSSGTATKTAPRRARSHEFLHTMAERCLVVEGLTVSATPPGRANRPRSRQRLPAARRASTRPYTLIAELTYRCPLRCVYCSNPLDYARHGAELDTATWLRVFAEAEDLGVVQLYAHRRRALSARRPRGPRRGRASARPLHEPRHRRRTALAASASRASAALGLDNVQISIQDVTRRGLGCDRRPALVRAQARGRARRQGARVPAHAERRPSPPEPRPHAEVIALAESLAADRLELANAQYLGWALAQPRRVAADAATNSSARERSRPRPASAFAGKHGGPVRHPGLLRDLPQGLHGRLGPSLPARLARRARAALPRGPHPSRPPFDSVRERPLGEIWRESPAFGASAAKTGCPSPAGAASGRHTTTAAVAARPFTSPERPRHRSHVSPLARPWPDRGGACRGRGPRLAAGSACLPDSAVGGGAMIARPPSALNRPVRSRDFGWPRRAP